MTKIHLGDCLNGCTTCYDNYHSGFNNLDCDQCGKFIEGAPICNACGQYEIHKNDVDCPAYNTEFSFGELTELLAKDGIKAEIMQTGGGNATMYLGEPNSDGFYPVVCGAGVYDYENPKNSYGWSNEFFIGRDDDKQGEGFYYKGANDVNKIANVIFNYFMEDLENTDTCSHCSRYPARQGNICNLCAGLEND